MTADVANIDISVLSEVATLIVNKVLYDITSEPHHSIEIILFV
jgi:GMP synthase PP-ATPase subunit